jgi:transcriptional regulator with XRE-family HTH domain
VSFAAMWRSTVSNVIASKRIDRSYFSAIERGEFNVTLGVLLKVASGLGVPAWELLKRAKL